MSNRRRRLLLATVLFLAALAACHRGAAPRPPAPDPLPPVTGRIRILHEVTFQRGELSLSGRAVLVRSGDTLELLLLSPFNTKLLHLRRSGTETETLFRSPSLPLPDTAYIVRDIEWIFFAEPPRRIPGAESVPYRRGAHTIFDRYDASGRLEERRISSRDTDVIIRYRPRVSGAGRFGRAILADRRAGYTLTITVDEWDESD